MMYVFFHLKSIPGRWDWGLYSIALRSGLGGGGLGGRPTAMEGEGEQIERLHFDWRGGRDETLTAFALQNYKIISSPARKIMFFNINATPPRQPHPPGPLPLTPSLLWAGVMNTTSCGEVRGGGGRDMPSACSGVSCWLSTCRRHVPTIPDGLQSAALCGYGLSSGRSSRTASYNAQPYVVTACPQDVHPGRWKVVILEIGWVRF